MSGTGGRGRTSADAVLETAALPLSYTGIWDLNYARGRLLRGEITINEARIAFGLVRVEGGDVKLDPPLPENLQEAFAELRRRHENGTDCRNQTGVSPSTAERSTTELSRQGEKDG